MFRLGKVLIFLALFASLSLAQGPVSVYGALNACAINGKGRLCGSGAWANTAVQVRGVSLGWSNTGWESSRFFNEITVNAMIDGWKSEVVRVPYGQDDAANWTRVKTAIDAAIAKDVYVVIDWHSHTADRQTAAAQTFFGTTIAEYHNDPHVILEIFNEPEAQTWAQIKTYSDAVIKTIRDKGANNLILIGTPEWSARPAAAIGNLLADPNVAYVFHFYADSHLTNGGDYSGYPSYSTGVTTMLNAGKPVFVSEYGTTHSDGGLDDKGHFDTHNKANSDAWFTFMDNHKISSAAWNVNDKHEGAAFFGKSTSGGGSFTQTAANYTNKNMMTESGAYIFDKLVAYAPTAPWRISSTPPEIGGGSGEGDVIVIDDFEDGDNLSNIGEYWYIYTDAGDGGESSFANEKDEEGDAIITYQDGDNWVAQIKDYTLVKAENAWAPYIAIGLDTKTFDLSQCAEGFSYRFKGSAHNFKSQQSDVEDYAYHYYQVSPASNDDWTTVTIALTDLQQPGSWGIKVPRDMTKVEGFSWELKGSDDGKTPNPSALTGFLMIDDFTCHLSASTPVARFKVASANVMRPINNGVSLQLKSNAALEIFSINGTSIRKMNFSSGTHSVKFQDLPKGLYVVKVRYGNSGQEIIKMPIR